VGFSLATREVIRPPSFGVLTIAADLAIGSFPPTDTGTERTGNLLAAGSVGAACGGFGSASNATATFDVFYRALGHG
jgi:hypothetical protein